MASLHSLTSSSSLGIDIEHYVDKIHRDLWMDDGNIVIAVLDHVVCQRHLFLAHVSMLILQSGIFHQAFSMPQPEELCTTYVGLPLVELYDSADDVAMLLSALYMPGFFLSLTKHDDQSEEKLAPVLRMAVKYEMDALRDRLLGHLLENWPNTLEGFDRSEFEIGRILEKCDHHPGRAHLPDPVRAILLATECDIDEILPVAYYDLSRTAWRPIDAPPADNHNADPPTLAGSVARTVNAFALTAGDLVRCTRGRGRMIQRAGEFAAQPSQRTATAIEECWNRDHIGNTCGVAIATFWAGRVVPVISSDEGLKDPLAALDRLAKERMTQYNVCEVCQEDIQRSISRTRKKWWGYLRDDFLAS